LVLVVLAQHQELQMARMVVIQFFLPLHLMAVVVVVLIMLALVLTAHRAEVVVAVAAGKVRRERGLPAIRQAHRQAKETTVETLRQQHLTMVVVVVVVRTQ
jgi:ubiquinone biosynthesis protein Coq4